MCLKRSKTTHQWAAKFISRATNCKYYFPLSQTRLHRSGKKVNNTLLPMRSLLFNYELNNTGLCLLDFHMHCQVSFVLEFK